MRAAPGRRLTPTTRSRLPDRSTSDERDETNGDGLPEEDAEEDQGETADLRDGDRFTGDHGTEQDTGQRVEQPDESDCSGAQMPQSREPCGEGDSGTTTVI